MRLDAFGLSLHAEVQPPGAWQPREPHEPRLQIRRASGQSIAHGWSGRETVDWQGTIDGAPFVVERGVAGDRRFVHGAPPHRSGAPTAATRAVHRLCAEANVLQCAPTHPEDPAWWRVVLDSVLFTVALLRGYEALHAGAVASSAGAIAITAPTGGGKSTLLAALLARGAPLVADDVLVLEPRAGQPPLAHPAAPVMTVPATATTATTATTGAPPPHTTEPAQTICSIGEERWIAVPAHPQSLPLKALVVLDRRPRARRSTPRPVLTRIERPLATLLGALMNFPASPERQLARFELASAVAGAAGLWRLTADLDTPPETLADALLDAEL